MGLFKKKPPTPEQIAAEEAKSFFDCICPSTVKFFPHHYIVGDSYRCVWAIKEYPPSTEEQAILSHLADHSGVTMRIYNRVVDHREHDQIINHANRKNRLKLGDSNITEAVQAEQNLLDVTALLNELKHEREPLLHCAVFLELKAKSPEGLQSLKTDLTMEITQAKLSVDMLTLRQKEGFLSVMPFGRNQFGTQFERVLPASSVSNMYPFNFSGKTDPHGFYIGRDRFGTNIIVDLDRRADDKTTGSALILGNSGMGKSYLLKLLVTNLRESGKSIIGLDAEGEMQTLAQNNGGCYLDFLDGKYMINLLEPKAWASEPVEDPDAPEAFRRSGRISQHIAFLKDWFRSYKDFSDMEVDTIEIMLSRLYEKFDITESTDFSKLKPTDYPIMEDLFELCMEEFHDAGHHPHVHMMAYSIDPKEAYLTEKGIETIKGELAREIFRQDHLCIYQKQTQYRDQLREQGRESVAEIVAQINSGVYSNAKVEALLVSLSDRLSRTSGKKVYGYLKADVKAIVDEIVAELAADERIQKLYNLWYEQREDVLRSYTDHFPERIPLEQNKEFKTIRNAVIQEAMKIVSDIRQAAELEPRQDVWEVGLPSGEEPDMEAMADPGYWMERFQPRFAEPEPVISESDPVDMESEDTPTLHSTDSKEWWSDYYKLARRFLYGTKTEKPDFHKAMPLLFLEANRGNGYACYDIGRMYLLGQGCEENEEEAQRWFRDALEAFQTAEMAAEKKGYLRYRIGKCHAYGHGAEQNYEESAKWFRQAVDENNPFAAYSLAGQYLRGQGVEQSDAEAYSLYHMAATHEKQSNAYAQYQLGKMHRDGIGTEVNLEESRLWYAKAYRGFLAMEENVADDRLYYRLGSMNMTGTGTEVDLERARYYFEKASELGNADALYGLGKLYLKPEFPDYDPAKAVEYLEKSATKGNAFAKYQLGKLLCQGELVPKDIARGLPLLEELAENGVTFASYIAGKVYLREEGWQDIKKAILYFRQAAEDGNSFAEYQLGRIYYFGNGVRADGERGLEYLKEAASHGNEYAANLLQTIQQQHTWGVASCTASLIAQLGRIFQEQDQKQSQRQRPRMDRKHRREIEEKKQALGIRD